MLGKIISWFNKERIHGHQPETDPSQKPEAGSAATSNSEKEISFDIEEIDLQGKPSKILVLKCEKTSQEVLHMLDNRLKQLADEAGLSKENRKQVMILNGEYIEFQTVDFGDTSES